MGTTDEDIISAIEELISANRAARQVMVDGEAVLREGIEKLRRGVRITDTLRDAPASRQRQATQDANDRITTARHDVRLLLIGRCLEEEMPPWEIGRAWGMSRQRVDRYIQELKRSTPSSNSAGT